MIKYTSNTILKGDIILKRKKSGVFKHVLKLLTGGLISTITGLFVALTCPVYLFRFLIILLAKIFRPDLDDILNGLSSLLANDYFYNSKSPRSNIILTLVIEGRDLQIDQLKEMLMERWVLAKDKTTRNLKFKQFQQYPTHWMGFTFWKKSTAFNINNHVFEHKQCKDDGVESYVNDNDLNNMCEILLNQPYLQFNSPWEVHLVKSYRTKNMTKQALIFKVHHCLADGYSMFTAVVEQFAQHKIGSSQLPVPRFQKRNILEQFIDFIYFPFSVFYEFSYALSQIFYASPWKIPDEKKEWHQVCAKSDFIPIDKVKFIKTQLEVTFTSVLLSAISTGIERSLRSFKKQENDLDDSSIYCLSVLPLPGHPTGLTNHLTSALLDLPFDKYDNPVQKLRDTNLMLETIKASSIPNFIPLYFYMMGCHLCPVGKFFGKLRITPIGVSNFPSVPIQIEDNGIKYLAGDFLAGGLDGTIGVLITVLSYNGYIRVGATAEKAIMSKEEVLEFTNYVISEINCLYDAALLKKSEKALAFSKTQ